VTLCDAAEDCIHLIVVPVSIVKDSSVNPEIPETTVTGSGVGIGVGSGREVGVGTGVTVGASVGVSAGVGSGILVLTGGLFIGVVSGVGTGFEPAFIPSAGHAILVHPKTPFVQKQLLQELLPVSFPVQPLWTVSPPVSLHTFCVAFEVCGAWADTVGDASAGTVASISRVGSTTAVESILGVGSAGVGVTVEQASIRVPISTARTTGTLIPATP